jgi:transcriptional regulator with XRE-family HTH domain
METQELPSSPPTKIEETLGEGLRSARSLKNLSLRDIEEATGISNAYLSQLENNKVKKPSPFFLHKLANLLGINYELLMAKAGYIIRNHSQPNQTLAGAALMSEKLTADEEDQLAQYLRFLRAQKKTKRTNVTDTSSSS